VPRFSLPPSPIEIQASAKADRFFDTMARRAGVLGTEGEGFEAWVYPLKLLHDCRIRVFIQDTGETVDLAGRIDHVRVRPESVTLTATHSLFTIREIFFTPLDRPGTVLLLEIDTARPLTLSVSFVPDLKPMWPAGLGGQYAAWSEERNLFVISESRHKYNGLIGCPAAVRGSSTPAHELGKGAVSFDIRVEPDVARRVFYPVVIAGSQTGREAAISAYTQLVQNIPAEYSNLAGHFRSVRDNFLGIETPEPQLNLALEWAKVAIDKGLVNNPDLGTGLVAGWGPSGESARPGFGWFFGGDAYLNQYAITAYGDFDTMRRAFRFLQQRQRSDGKMMHELTQSAAWLNWFEDYPYGYYHGDTTPFYIASLYDFCRQSGDVALLRESWESLKRAFAFCKSTDEDGDGLMDNTKAGLGASELGSLLEGLKTDIYLGALSPAAWRAIASAAETMGDTRVRDEANSLLAKAVRSATGRFWSEETGTLIHALTVSGGQNREITAWPALGIMLGVFRGREADATVEQMGSAALSSDWGVRMLARTSKAYDPAAYNNGAVWPFLTGLVSAAEFERHRSFSGFQLLMANARLTWAGALGAHPELLSGDFYRPLETAVPHQLFSSGGIVTPLVRGLLGLRGDAIAGVLEFTPHIPPGWNTLRVSHYRVGGQVFNISLERVSHGLRCIIDGGRGGFRVRFSPAIGLFSNVRSATVNGKRADFTLDDGSGQDVHCTIETELSERTEVALEFEPGVELDAAIEPLLAGDSSRNLRILGVRKRESGIAAILEGLAGETYRVRLWTGLPIGSLNEAKLIQGEPKLIELAFPSGPQGGFLRKTLEISLGPK
jgi:glycogen debranching enzyme